MRRWRDWSHYVAHLRKKGFVQIGSGFYSTVFAKPGAKTVTKLGPLDDAWPVYAAWAVKNGYAGNLAPGIKKFEVIRVTDGVDFYVAVMERLEKTVARAVIGSRAVSEYYATTKTTRSFQRLFRRKVPEKFAQFVTDIRRLRRKHRLDFDLHDLNFMVRKNGDLVVTDPVTDGSKRSRRWARRSLAQTLSHKRARKGATHVQR